ncbi:MAG: helix-turn-helix domain-containing protein [Bacilli bacterium]|jgi:transcriptional regulator with XRE-family HTH domain|nr:helix-turn-helix domain-containing protein [Bacilli bacterium]HBG42623.1 XRE family transcriptional regulator [Porphyromonadaceae bacterium]
MTGRDIMESQIIGSRIREVRIKKGMSQAELAVKANISLPHISDIELGKTRMMLASFVRLTEALQVSADSLLRTDIPEVKGLYQNEFAEILSDCTPAEIDSILKIVKELKSTMHKKEEY